MRVLWLLVLAGAMLVGLAAEGLAAPAAKSATPAAPPAAAQTAASPAATPAAPPQYLVPRVPKQLTLCGAAVPLELPLVAEQLDRELVISVHDPARVIMWLKRAGRYFPYISQRLKEAGLPQDLKYLAVAESSLIHYIRSVAGAVGPWQFMAATGRRYGLRVDHWFDDRRSLPKSTQAALAYLKDLQKEFGSWPLAMAAYNCGEKRVRQELKEQAVKDYFNLALPNETQRYVYRILAVKIILSDPKRFGFDMPPDSLWRPLPSEKASLELKRPLHLTVLAQAAGTTFRGLKELNPELRERHLPRGKHQIMVPPGQAAGLAARLGKAGPGPRPAGEVYVVQRGDNLSGIALRHGISLKDLRQANRLSRDRLLQPGERLIIPEK
ncbi:MAG: LysM peptidoglycan-binding domain-containing protein [Desulfarculus sp.]|nr:MAG: LysM peptidoglycan-binding domain-containing protein [Desulfarculus sp.]